MVVQGQLVKPAVCFSYLYEVFLEDKVRDTRQNQWTMKYRSQWPPNSMRSWGGGGEGRKWIFWQIGKLVYFFFGGVGGGGGGRGGWKFNIHEQMCQMALLLFKKNDCAKLFWNPCINVQIMAWTSSICDHFTIWPSNVTLTFNQPKQMFKMALLLLKENTCAKLFWNPCINVQVMARTSSINDHFIIWPSSVTLTFNLPKQMFQMELLLLKENICAKIILKSMHKCTSYGPDKLN